MTRERFGTVTSLYHNVHYNKRLQAVDVRLGTSSTDEWTWNRGALITYYSDAARSAGNAFNDPDGGNSGNVTMQEHYVPLDDAISSYVIAQRDIYDYDALNRISQVTGQQRTTGGSYPTLYTQGYAYDRWGNRTINAGATSGANVNNTVFTVDAATNRFTALGYDNAGNVTNDAVTGAGMRTYDAENRVTSAQAFSGGPSYYVYDADGRRVRRIVAGVETWQVYGFGGELLAEYPANGATNAPSKEYASGGQTLIVGEAAQVRWTVKDTLGTARIVAGKNGTLAEVTRHDYLPFGEEVFIGTGNSSVRTTGMGYATAGTVDGIRQKFGSKERDSETGLDFFVNRYFSSTQGRFTSDDPLNIPALQRFDPKGFLHTIAEPHNWNGYTYAHNNPLSKIDPDGLLTIVIAGTWYDPKAWLESKEGKAFIAAVEKQFGEKAVFWTKNWDGGDNKLSREAAAKALLEFIKDYKFADGEKLNIIAHSHGGNVGFLVSQNTTHKIDTLVTLGTPIRNDYVPNESNIGQHLQVYSRNDMVQSHGGGAHSAWRHGQGEYGPAERALNLPGVKNLDATKYTDWGPKQSHSDLWMKPEVWNRVVTPELKK